MELLQIQEELLKDSEFILLTRRMLMSIGLVKGTVGDAD